MALWRVGTGSSIGWARGPVHEGPRELLPSDVTLAGLLGAGSDALQHAATTMTATPLPVATQVLPPVDTQEVWAAGVTYERSRSARREESAEPDLYERVYEALRPELFFKSNGWRVRGNGQPIGIRADSTWDVPEPELVLVVTSGGEIVGYTIGNDVSSRSIEGENALYLPQAKCYVGACAIGPCIVPLSEAPPVADMTIGMRIVREDRVVFDGQIDVDRMKRRCAELVEWLFGAQDFPDGVLLLTGTGLVPAAEFTLREGDEVRVRITGLGELTNRVQRVGKRTAPSAARLDQERE